MIHPTAAISRNSTIALTGSNHCMIRPQRGHFDADRLTGPPQSGHLSSDDMGDILSPPNPGVQACPVCGPALPVFVHGHYQCRRCGCVLVPCCEGQHRIAIYK